MKWTLSIPNEEFEKDHPVAARTIEYFVIGLGISCVILVLLVAPIVTIILVCLGIISPWCLFLGCGPLALMLCLCVCCFVGEMITIILYGPVKKNKPINQAATV